jgi:hypothetical protein
MKEERSLMSLMASTIMEEMLEFINYIRVSTNSGISFMLKKCQHHLRKETQMKTSA